MWDSPGAWLEVQRQSDSPRSLDKSVVRAYSSIHIYIYVCICMYVCMYVGVSNDVRMYLCAHGFMYVCKYVCTYVHAHICLSLYVYTHMYIYMCAYIIYIHMYNIYMNLIYIYIYTYVCFRDREPYAECAGATSASSRRMLLGFSPS